MESQKTTIEQGTGTGLMKASLIVPIYNAEKDLPFLFSSLIQQSHPFDEIILIDNGSLDSSLEICHNFREKNSTLPVMILQEKVPGPGPARNKGINAATGDIICFTDSDCVPDKDFAHNIRTFFAEHENTDIVGGIAVPKDPLTPRHEQLSIIEEFSLVFWSDERSSASGFPLNRKEDFFSDAPFYITTYNMACRKKVLDIVGEFSHVKAMEDIDFWIRACEKGLRSEAGFSGMKVFHKNRATFLSLWKQFYGYIFFLPWILKSHFSGRFTITCQMKSLFTFSFIGGLIEINPHTLLIPFLFLRLSLVPWLILILFLYKYISMARRLRKKKQPFLIKSLIFACIMEWRRLAMTCGAVAGSIRHRIFCLI